MRCPVCGMEMELKKKDYYLTTTFGKAENKINLYVCPDCGYDVDDKKNNNKIKEELKKEIYSSYMTRTLTQMKKEGKNFTELERKFNLPSKTLSKWMNKSNNPSAAAVTLIRLIKAFPWLETVSEYEFESERTEEMILNYYLDKVSNDYQKISYSYCEEKSKVVFKAVFSKTEKNNDVFEYENCSLKDLPYSFGGQK